MQKKKEERKKVHEKELEDLRSLEQRVLEDPASAKVRDKLVASSLTDSPPTDRDGAVVW